MQKQIINEKGYSILIREIFYPNTQKIERVLQVIDDWKNVLDFDFDDISELDELIEALNNLRTGWIK